MIPKEGIVETSQALATRGLLDGWVASVCDALRPTRSNIVPAALLATALVVFGDYLTGAELAFTLLYLAPIALAAWYRGRVFGVVVSVLSVAGATLIELDHRLHDWHGRPIHALHMVWNQGGSLLIFVGFVLLIGRLREYADRERMARLATVEQLRQVERLGVIGQLAAGVAHELGTPLNVIMGHAEMIDSDDTSRAMLRASSTTILAQSRKMTGIIRGLLDFSHRGGCERAEVDVVALAKGATALVESIARKHQVAIELRVSGETPILAFGNRTELEQVLVNLTMNAIHAMPGGGTLRVSVGSAPARGEQPAAVCIEVEDEGVGIPEENLGRVFDPFFTTKGVGEGTGLGLSVSYGIVCDHQGQIDVSSKVGRGSRFSVRLPLLLP